MSSVYHFCLRLLSPAFTLSLIIISTASAETCLDCHPAVLKQFRGNSHHIQGVDATNRHCYSCHWEATEDGAVNSDYHRSSSSVKLVVWSNGKRPAEYLNGKTAVTFAPDAIGTGKERGEVAKITVHCLSCHGDEAMKSTPFGGDPNTPAKYAWDKESIASRYARKDTTSWGKYSTANSNRKKQVSKALSAHGNAAANEGGWKELIGYDGEMPLSRGGKSAKNVECFDCHNSHGSSISGVTSSYTTFDSSSNGGILKQTVPGQSGYKTAYQPSVNSYGRSKNPFNPGAGLCFDCHETSSAGTTPWGYSSTFGAAKPVMGYKDTAGFADGIKGSSGKFGSKQGRGEIASSHLKSGTPLQHPPAGQINGLCTPCHDPHGVSRSLGENIGYAVPLLKGSWLTSPYREDGPPDRLPVRKRSGIDDDEGFNAVNREAGSNLAGNTGYNSVNRATGSNFAKDADFNRVNRDAGSNFNKEDADYNRVNRDAGSNFAKGDADYNRVNRNAGSNFSKSGTDYNRVNKEAGSNFAKEPLSPDYNRINRDANSNFAKEGSDYNRVNRDSGSNFNKQNTDYNRVNRDAGSNFAKGDADYNRINRDAGSNFSGTDYNRVNKDAGSNFDNKSLKPDYNRVNRDAGSNFNTESADYNRVNRDANSNIARSADKPDRETDANSTNRDANSNFTKSSAPPREPLQGMKYHVDRNTFGIGKQILEDDNRFAGLCLKCHNRESLAGTGESGMVHKTVKGWGSNREHSFPCSKCHQAHNSGLPRLMQTNCFEKGPPGLRANSAAAWSPLKKESESAQDDPEQPGSKMVGCHVRQFGRAGSSPDGNWREVSPW